MQSVLNGERGEARDIVVLNTAAALYCAECAPDISTGIKQAQQAIDTGKAKQCFEQLQLFSQRVNS